MSVSVADYVLVYTRNSQVKSILIGRPMTAPPPVLSPSSILLLPTSHCALIPVTRNSARISKIPLTQFFVAFYLQIARSPKLPNLIFRTSLHVCVCVCVCVCCIVSLRDKQQS